MASDPRDNALIWAQDDVAIRDAKHFKFLLLNRDHVRHHLRFQEGILADDYAIVHALEAMVAQVPQPHRNWATIHLRWVARYRMYCSSRLGVSPWPVEPVRVSLFCAEEILSYSPADAPRRATPAQREEIGSALEALEWARGALWPLYRDGGFWSTGVWPLTSHQAVRMLIDEPLHAPPSQHPSMTTWGKPLPGPDAERQAAGTVYDFTFRARWLAAYSEFSLRNPYRSIPSSRMAIWTAPTGMFPCRAGSSATVADASDGIVTGYTERQLRDEDHSTADDVEWQPIAWPNFFGKATRPPRPTYMLPTALEQARRLSSTGWHGAVPLAPSEAQHLVAIEAMTDEERLASRRQAQQVLADVAGPTLRRLLPCATERISGGSDAQPANVAWRPEDLAVNEADIDETWRPCRGDPINAADFASDGPSLLANAMARAAPLGAPGGWRALYVDLGIAMPYIETDQRYQPSIDRLTMRKRFDPTPVVVPPPFPVVVPVAPQKKPEEKIEGPDVDPTAFMTSDSPLDILDKQGLLGHMRPGALVFRNTLTPGFDPLALEHFEKLRVYQANALEHVRAHNGDQCLGLFWIEVVAGDLTFRARDFRERIWPSYETFCHAAAIPLLPIEPVRVGLFLIAKCGPAVVKTFEGTFDERLVAQLVADFEFVRRRSAHLFNWAAFTPNVRQSLWKNKVISTMLPETAAIKLKRLEKLGPVAIDPRVAHEEDDLPESEEHEAARRKMWQGEVMAGRLPMRKPDLAMLPVVDGRRPSIPESILEAANQAGPSSSRARNRMRGDRTNASALSTIPENGARVGPASEVTFNPIDLMLRTHHAAASQHAARNNPRNAPEQQQPVNEHGEEIVIGTVAHSKRLIARLGEEGRIKRWEEDAKIGRDLDLLGDRAGQEDYILTSETHAWLEDAVIREVALQALRETQDGSRVSEMVASQVSASFKQHGQGRNLEQAFQVYLHWATMHRVSPYPIEPLRVTCFFVMTPFLQRLADGERCRMISILDSVRNLTFPYFRYGSFWPWCEDSLWSNEMVCSLVKEPWPAPRTIRFPIKHARDTSESSAVCPIQRRYWNRHASVELLPLHANLPRSTPEQRNTRKRDRSEREEYLRRECLGALDRGSSRAASTVRFDVDERAQKRRRRSPSPTQAQAGPVAGPSQARGDGLSYDRDAAVKLAGQIFGSGGTIGTNRGGGATSLGLGFQGMGLRTDAGNQWQAPSDVATRGGGTNASRTRPSRGKQARQDPGQGPGDGCQSQ